MDNGASITTGTNNVASHTSSLASDPQLNENAPELTFSLRIRRFKKINSYWATIILMFIYVVFLALILPLHWYCSSRYCSQSSFSTSAYANIGVWFITVVLTFLVHLEFEAVKKKGYAIFYKKNHSYVRDPFAVFSTGNAALLVYTWILSDTKVLQPWGPNYASLHQPLGNSFDKAEYFIGFQIIIFIEVLISFVFLIILTAKIIKFNGQASPPDAINDGIMARSVGPRSVVGYSDSTCNQDLVIDRQMDDINFLKARCRLLYGSVRKLLASVSSEQRKCLEGILKLYLEEHHNDDDDDTADINEYLSTGRIPTDDDTPLLSA